MTLKAAMRILVAITLMVAGVAMWDGKRADCPECPECPSAESAQEDDNQ